MLSETQVSPTLSLSTLVAISEGLSGSDLKEMCRNAAMVPVREYMREHAGELASLTSSLTSSSSLETEGLSKAEGIMKEFKIRPLQLSDFLVQDGETPGPLANSDPVHDVLPLTDAELGVNVDGNGEVPEDRSRLDGDDVQ